MSDRWAPLEQLLEDGVSQGVFTGAVALVGLQGELAVGGGGGPGLPGPGRGGRDPGYDLRPGLLDETPGHGPGPHRPGGPGQLDPAASLGEILPSAWLPPDKRPLTLNRLLTHRSGLPAWRPFYQEVLAAPAPARPTLLERLAAATPLEYPPDTATLYSDLGFMLLKAVVERPQR